MLRRSRFWLRFSALVVCMALPWTVVLVRPVGEQATLLLLLLGLAWALLLVALAPLLLFRRPGADPGQSDDSGGGPGPRDDGRRPDRPTGELPLSDAEQGKWRLREPHKPRPRLRRRRPVREPDRRPSRVRSPGRGSHGSRGGP